MKVPRFYLSDMGLILETPVPLSDRQRDAVAKYAEAEYRRRLKTARGDIRDATIKIITALRSGNFLERPIPAHDCDKEAIAYGQ